MPSFLSGYGKRKAIKYGTAFPTANLTDFPKLFEISGDTDIAAELASGGGIAVTAADGTTTVPFGLYPSSTPSSGSLILRALFSPLTAATTGQTLGYIYYDHTQTTSQNRAGVVANGYALFMPMEEDPSGSAPQMRDWVTDTLLGTSAGSMTSGDLVAAQVAKGLLFDGVDDEIDIPGSLQTQYTLECWFNLTNLGTLLGTIDHSNTGVHDRELSIDGSGRVAVSHFDGSTKVAFTPVAISGSTSYYAVGRYDGSDLQVFLNGAASGSPVSAGNPFVGYVTPYYYIGSRAGGGGAPGWQDEVRISSAARSDDWIGYVYTDEKTNSDTFSLGVEETAGGGGVILTASISQQPDEATGSAVVAVSLSSSDTQARDIPAATTTARVSLSAGITQSQNYEVSSLAVTVSASGVTTQAPDLCSAHIGGIGLASSITQQPDIAVGTATSTRLLSASILQLPNNGISAATVLVSALATITQAMDLGRGRIQAGAPIIPGRIICLPARDRSQIVLQARDRSLIVFRPRISC